MSIFVALLYFKIIFTVLPFLHCGYLYKQLLILERYPYADARELFLNPEVADPETLEIKWGEPDIEGLVDFLVREKGFSEERVRTGAARLSKGLKTKQQGIHPPSIPSLLPCVVYVRHCALDIFYEIVLCIYLG